MRQENGLVFLSMRTVKGHILSDHIVDFMDKFDGIAEGFEDWNEQEHQTYIRITNKGKIRNQEAAVEYYSRQQALFNDRTIRKQIEEVNHARKRIFKVERGPLKPEQEKAARIARRKWAVEEFKRIYAEKPVLETNLQRNVREC